MSIFTDISYMFDTQLGSMVGKPNTIAYENRPVSPNKDELYLRATLLPGDVEQSSLGDNGTDRNVGIYQVDVFAPSGKGKKEAIEMADLIANQFKRGTYLNHNGRTLRIRAVSRQASQNDVNGWFMIPVEVHYIAYTEARI